MCVVCKELRDDVKASLCGHIACTACWNSLLERKLECCVCRARVLPKQLVALRLNG
jgi:hypothetical protein